MHIKGTGGTLEIPIEVSARHIHVSEADFRLLFRQDQLTAKRHLSQPGQFAAEENVTVRGPQGEIEKVRIVGPFRTETQVELSVSDCRKLGVTPHFSLSGTLEGSPGVSLVGPACQIILPYGAIVALTHMHMDPEEAAHYGFSHLDKVAVVIKGDRTVSFHNVVVRSREGIDKLSLHIDTDQANAVGRIEEAKIVSLEKEIA